MADANPFVRLKFLAQVNPTLSAQLSPDTRVAFISMSSVAAPDVYSYETRRLSECTGYTAFEEGDVVFAKVTPCFQNRNAFIARNLPNGVGFGSTEFHVLRPRSEEDARFLLYLVTSEHFIQSGLATLTGVAGLKRVGTEFIKSFVVRYPGNAGAREIGAFLDAETARIDALVAELTGFAELLKARDKSLVAECVTQGVPHRRAGRAMKDSGVDWIGQVPEGWEILPAKRLYRQTRKPVVSGDEIVTCFRDGEVTLRKNRRASGFTEAEVYAGYQHVDPGDLVIHQMDAAWGAIGVSDSAGMSTPAYLVCEPLSQSSQHYYAHLLRTMAKRGWILSLSRGTRERSVDFRYETFRNQFIPVPPLPEQQEIVAYLDEELAKSRELQGELENQVGLLTAYRKSLISEAVTGKIVRYDFQGAAQKSNCRAVAMNSRK